MKKRTTCPSNNKYYIRQVSGGLNGAVQGYWLYKPCNTLCNCVGYANGRFNEIINDPELQGINKVFLYQLVCNAENFIESAKRQGLKISAKPVLGGIMVWQKGATLNAYDGAGHVEVVEQINKDGSIVCSSSGYGDAGWSFRLLTRDNSNGNWGQSSPYKYRGCIINPSIKDGETPTEQPLVVDGVGGGLTVMASQRFFNLFEDGVVGGQYANQQKYRRALTAVENGGGGSKLVSAIQKWLGIKVDGYWAHDTSLALQKRLVKEGFEVGPDGCDGYFGHDSMCAWQRFLNWKVYNVSPPSPKPVTDGYLVLDVSEFQKPIDWEKAKKDGVKGVIVRCGLRFAESGKLAQDSMFVDHITGAHKAGLKVGAYMFTEAINASEGKQEAIFALDIIKRTGIKLDYPVAVDTENVFWYEGKKKCSGRANSGVLSKTKRTEAIKAFCEEVKSQGYTPMIYASLSWFDDCLDMSKLPYDVWCAQYYKECQYKGEYVMWQYTSEGSVNGVKGVVDMNKCYITSPAPMPTPTPTPSSGKIGQATKDYDGKAGDSSGKEVCKSNFSYSTSPTSCKNWTYVFRPKDSSKAEKAASMCEKAIANNAIGYNKKGETAYGKDKAMSKLAKAVNYDLSKITTKCGLSCGDLICLCNHYAGLSTCYIGSALPLAESYKKNSNFECLNYKKGMALKRGDVLITAHSNGKNNHVAMVL